MVNRKRYYNNFFDQINDYKNKVGDKKPEHGFFNYQVLGSGVVGSLLLVGLIGGYIKIPTLNIEGANEVAYNRAESVPAYEIFKALSNADESSASEGDGTKVSAIVDAYVKKSSANLNFGNEQSLFSGGSDEAKAYLNFDLTSLKSKEDLILKLTPKVAFTGTIQIFALNNEVFWDESTLTYANGPKESGKVIGRSSGTFNAEESIDFDLKDALMNEETAKLVVVASGSKAGFEFYARESGLAPIVSTVR